MSIAAKDKRKILGRPKLGALKFIHFFARYAPALARRSSEKGENVIRIKYFYLLGSKNKNQFNEIDAKVGAELCYLFTRTPPGANDRKRRSDEPTRSEELRE